VIATIRAIAFQNRFLEYKTVHLSLRSKESTVWRVTK
jgi:hypothetical protein